MAWRLPFREGLHSLRVLGLRSILIVLVLVNVVWAVWSSLSRGTPGFGDDPAHPRAPAPGLRLLSELPPEDLHARSKAKATTRPTPEAPAPDLSRALASIDAPRTPVEQQQNCVVMGPFDALEQVEALRDEIIADGGSAEIVTEEVEGQPDYLVFIDTTGSRDVARRIREELQGQTIDSHIIAGGDLENALSVGVFSQERLARRQFERVSALGYEAAIHELPRRQTVYHVMSDRTLVDPAIPGRSACHEIASAH